MLTPRLLFALTLTLFAAGTIYAQSETHVNETGVNTSAINRASVSPVTVSDYETRLFKTDGLDDADYANYQAIRQTYLGDVYDGVDPSFLLALYAKKTGDIKNYDRFVAIAAQRSKRELDDEQAFSLDVGKKGKALYPDTAYFNADKIKQWLLAQQRDSTSVGSRGLTSAEKVPGESWYIVIVQDECVVICDQDSAVKKLIKQATREKRYIEFAFADTFDDSAITTWARRMGISAEDTMGDAKTIGLKYLNQDPALSTYYQRDLSVSSVLPAYLYNSQSQTFTVVSG